MVERILVPTDGSKSAQRAAERAIEVAKRDGATVHALHVASMGDVDFVAVPHDIAETRDHLEREGTEFVEEIVEMGEASGVAVVTDVRTGNPEDEIVEYTTDNDVDMIVMGKRGRAGLDRLLVGSTTKRVMAMTDVPVQAV